MESLISFGPLILLVIAIAVVVRWRRYLKGEGSSNHKAPTAASRRTPAGKRGTTSKQQPVKKSSTTSRQPEAGASLYCGASLDRLDKDLAAKLKKQSYVLAKLDEEAVLEDSGPIPVLVEGSRVLGYLSDEVVKDIRGADIAHELGVEIIEIWIGDRGGAKVEVELTGTKEHEIRLLEYEISKRPAGKSNKPGYLRGHPTHEYTPDRVLLQVKEDWAAYEKLLKELIEADCQSPDEISGFHVYLLARFYRENKRYADEVQLLTDFQEVLKNRGQSLDEKLSKRLRRATQLAGKTPL